MPDYSFLYFVSFRYRSLQPRFLPSCSAPFQVAILRCCLKCFSHNYLPLSRTRVHIFPTSQTQTCTSRHLGPPARDQRQEDSPPRSHISRAKRQSPHPLLPPACRPRQQLKETRHTHRTHLSGSRCATSWSSSTRHAGASTTSTPLTAVRHTAGQATESRGRRYSSGTPAASTHHTRADTTTPTPRNTRTRDTTLGGHPGARGATAGEECCL